LFIVPSLSRKFEWAWQAGKFEEEISARICDPFLDAPTDHNAISTSTGRVMSGSQSMPLDNVVFTMVIFEREIPP
jgi:hypothetical protein